MRPVTMGLLVLASACATTPTGAPASPSGEDTRKLAESYLAALAGTGDGSGRDLLLGGATTSCGHAPNA